MVPFWLASVSEQVLYINSLAVSKASQSSRNLALQKAYDSKKAMVCVRSVLQWILSKEGEVASSHVY